MPRQSLSLSLSKEDSDSLNLIRDTVNRMEMYSFTGLTRGDTVRYLIRQAAKELKRKGIKEEESL